jgi:hypothetical protein
MSYTAPDNTAVDFEFQSYTAPTNTSVDFTFDKTSTEAKVFSTAAISQTTSAFGDLQGNTTATQDVSTTPTCPTDTVGQHPSIVTALTTAVVRRRQGELFSFSAGRSQSTFSIIGGRTITNTPKLDTQADANFFTPAEYTDGAQTSVSVDESLTVDLLNDPLFAANGTDSLTSTTTKRRVTLAAVAAARTVPSGFEVLEITDNQRAGDASFDVDFPGPSDDVDFRQRSHEVIYLDANDS